MDAAKSIAARIVKSLGGRGVFGVELMVRGDEMYFSDVTARPFESGLVTLRTQRLSEFELQARAILGLPTDTIMISPGAAEVIYAGQDGSGAAQSSRARRSVCWPMRCGHRRATRGCSAATRPKSGARWAWPSSPPRT